MDDKGTGTERASAEREALVAREGADDERSRLADERERRAEAREAAANQRERAADEREAAADGREREADRREAAEAGRWQQLERREEELDVRVRELGTGMDGLEQRILDTIEHSRALLALSAQRLDRREEGVQRSRGRRERQQAEIDRAAAETEGKLADWLPDPGTVIERGKALREQACLAIRAVASNEEQAARLYQDLAARRPERREEYLRKAQQARASARQARASLTAFTS